MRVTDDPITIALDHEGLIVKQWIGPAKQYTLMSLVPVFELPAEVELWMEILEKTWEKKNGKTHKR